LVALACCCTWSGPASAQRRTDSATKTLEADTHSGFVPVVWDRVRVIDDGDKTIWYNDTSRLTSGFNDVWNRNVRPLATEVMRRELANPDNLLPKMTFQEVKVDLSRSGPMSIAVRPSKFGMKWTLPSNRIECTLTKLPSKLSWANPRFSVTFDLDFIIWVKPSFKGGPLTVLNVDYSVAEVRNVRVDSQFAVDRAQALAPGMMRMLEVKLNERQLFDQRRFNWMLPDAEQALRRVDRPGRPLTVEFERTPTGYLQGGLPQFIGVLNLRVGR
jgi:hypothetical protein